MSKTQTVTNPGRAQANRDYQDSLRAAITRALETCERMEAGAWGDDNDRRVEVWQDARESIVAAIGTLDLTFQTNGSKHRLSGYPGGE